MANLSKTLHINFYQNRSSIVEVMIKKFWCVFMPHSVVGEDRSVTPECPRETARLQRSAGAKLVKLPASRTAKCLQPWSGGWTSGGSTWHRKAWWAGVSSASLATWPKSEFRLRVIVSDTGPRPAVSGVTSPLRIADVVLCQRILVIWRWHFVRKASKMFYVGGE